MAEAVHESHFIKEPGHKWFDGYEGEEVLVFDELSRDTLGCKMLLRLLDYRKCDVEVKGGKRNMVSKVIVVTCDKSPQELWASMAHLPGHGDVSQLERRLTEVAKLPQSDDYKLALLARMRSALERLYNRQADQRAPAIYKTSSVRRRTGAHGYTPAMFILSKRPSGGSSANPPAQEAQLTGGSSGSAGGYASPSPAEGSPAKQAKVDLPEVRDPKGIR